MKKLYILILAFVLTITAEAQTLNVQVGCVTYRFPASQAGEMTFADGETLTIQNKVFALSDISRMTVDSTHVTDNTVTVAYNDTVATVDIAGNIAQYVTAAISGAHVAIAQSNTTAVNGNEITYRLHGTATDGSLTLSGAYKCTVSLEGLTMTNLNDAAINITNSKRIQLSAKNGTENTLADGNGPQKACIYSKGQLQLQGNGKLNVTGNQKHAIKSASYITVKNLTLNIASAVGDGINCEEYMQMKSGTVTISGVGDDGIQCDLGSGTPTGETADHEDEETGNIYLDGGTLTVTANATAAKCVKSEGSIFVNDGTIELHANGAVDLSDTSDPSYAAGFKADSSFTQNGGDITINVTGAAGRGISVAGTFEVPAVNTGTLTIKNTGATSSGNSYHCTAKGIKAGTATINGGAIGITMNGAAAKGIKADSDDGSGNMVISGGTIAIATSGSGSYDRTGKESKGAGCLKADNDMEISGGTLTLKSTGTGGKCIKTDGTLLISGGTVSAATTGGTYSYSSSKAQPKAIKSDGNMTVSGGNVTATSNSHEAIETKSTFTVTDGTVYAFSASDDAINSAGEMHLRGGTVSGISNGNDGIDSNGNMYISGGNVLACGSREPECGLDAAKGITFT